MRHDPYQGCHTQGDWLRWYCSGRWLVHGNSTEGPVTLGRGDWCPNRRGILAPFFQPVTPKPKLGCALSFFTWEDPRKTPRWLSCYHEAACSPANDTS